MSTTDIIHAWERGIEPYNFRPRFEYPLTVIQSRWRTWMKARVAVIGGECLPIRKNRGTFLSRQRPRYIFRGTK